MTRSQLIFLIVISLLVGYAVGEPAQPPRGAVAGVEAGEIISAREAKAQEAEKNSDWALASNAYRGASQAAKVNGQYQKAIAHGNKALEMGEKAGSPFLQARAVMQLVLVHNLVRQRAASKALLEKGIELVKQIPLGPAKFIIEANMYRELGFYYYLTGDPKQAVDYISYSLQVQENQLAFFKRRPGVLLKNPRIIKITQGSMVQALWRLGNAHRSAGNLEDAANAYERALAIMKEAGFKGVVEDRIYQELGQLYLRQKDFPRAQENLEKAVQLAERSRHAYVIYRASSQIGDLLRQTYKASEAIPHYKKAIESIESTRSLLESEDLRSSFFEDKRQTYAGIILAYLGGKNVEEAFNYNERARSRAFLDILGSKVQLARGEMLEEERALQARISSSRAKLAAEEEHEEDEEAVDPGRLRQELEEAQKAYDDFLAKVRKENKEQASLMSVEPLTLKEVQELLDPGVSVLEYFVVSNQILLWVVEKERVRFARIPVARTELVKKVAALRDTVFQVGEQDRFKSSSRELYKLVIEPALPHIRGKELLIIPHDVLHYLPYQALVSPQGKYLIQDFPIYYLSSASLMQFTREKRRASRETGLALGNPSLGDPAYDLRFAEREAREMSRIYPKTDVFLKEQATKSKAVSLSPTHDILHFAVHAEFNETDPVSSALLLAREGDDDGKLKVGEIFSMNLKADMVVLSACETGLGKISGGDEIVGMTRAFIYAGTPSVVTTLWKVNDRSSYELMRQFYSNLKTMKKSAALRQAQLKTMKEFPHPFFWAAYGLTGEP